MILKATRFRDRLARALFLGLMALREIFDESAYARFLTRHQVASSPDAYAGFLREQAHMHSRRHRCC